MWKSLTEYHANLLQKGANSEDVKRYFEIQWIALPWILLLGAMVAAAAGAEALFGAHYGVQVAIVLLIGFPCWLGLLHATGTYLFAAIRADRRRKKSSAEKG